MRPLKELGRFISGNYILTGLKITIIVMLLGITYMFLLFSHSLSKVDSNFKSVYENKEIFQLIDNFYKASDFSEFRNSDHSMLILKSFYENLNNENKFSFISSFNQALAINDFKGDRRFLYGENNNEFEMNGKFYNSVKSMQMNKNAFGFYNLKVESGEHFNWKSIDYSHNEIPVLLGSGYHGIYKIGDVIEGEFYSMSVDLKVIGFLEKDAAIYYQNEMNHSLNDYIVLPYPEKGYEKMDKEFRGILYFAMINGNIAVENSEGSLDIVLKELDKISQSTGYYNYSLIGLPQFIIQYNTVISTICANKKLIVEMLVLLITISAFVLSCISYFIYKNRKGVYYVYDLIGYSKRDISLMMIREISLPYIVALLSVCIAIYYKEWFNWGCVVDLIMIDFGLMMCTSLFIYTVDNRDH